MPAFDRFGGADRYIADDGLMEVVNAAIALQRPLLVKGEPGTGKTLLASAVAESLGLDLISWHVKSTTKAVDGLYQYDVVQRLNDSRFGDADVSDIRNYIKLGHLGRAFASDKRVVVLIDDDYASCSVRFSARRRTRTRRIPLRIGLGLAALGVPMAVHRHLGAA